ncbi:VWA domain-containing protein, partial [Sedimentibacter sp.]|uniref:VWA domain-containing protein n=1 Tax=Sedimentibacter sp. TaxID=1960295 RepID=UPI00289D7569
MIVDKLFIRNKNKEYKETKILKKGGQFMNKTNMLKKILCFTIALLMLMPAMPGSMVSAANMKSNGGPVMVGDSVSVDKYAYVVNDATIKDYWVQFDIKGDDTVVDPIPLDVVLVLDRSGSMAGDNRLGTLKTAAINFVDKILNNNLNNRVSILTFSDGKNGYTITDFTNDSIVLENAINAMAAKGDTNTGEAFKKAKELLDKSKNDRSNAKRVLVLFTDGAPAPSGANVDYSYSKNATVQARAIRTSYPEIPMYCVYWNPDVESGAKFYLGSGIPSGDVERIGNDYREKTWGKTLVPEYYIFWTDYYLRINNSFIIDTLLPTFVSDPSKLIGASTNPAELEEVFDGISGQILNFATDVQLYDVVEDENFSLNIIGPGDVQYREAVTSGSNNNSWENMSSSSVDLINYSIAGNAITINFDEISHPGKEVRFKIKLNDNVCSSKEASAESPDLDTNKSAEITFTDALGTLHEDAEIEIYPKVYVPGYTVTYDGNDNTSGTVPTDDNSYIEGATVIVLGQNNLERAGYTFLGWSKTATATEAEYVESDTFGMPDSDVTLYAVWEIDPDKWHTVTYDGNDNTSGTVPTDDNSYIEGATVTVLGQNNLERAGYTFLGWS